MKTIKVFLASSSELRDERMEFSDIVLTINKFLKPRGFEIEMERWEDIDDSMGPERKQDEYNRVLRTCPMCLVLYWKNLGSYTKEELDVAYAGVCSEKENPRKLYIYFKEDKEIAETISKELRNFKASFETDYGHFYCRFENADTMRLRFLLQVERYLNEEHVEKFVKVEDSKITVDGHRFADLQNIPFAGNNEEFQQLVKDINDMQAIVMATPGVPALQQKLHNLKERREKIEQSLLDTARLITKISTETSSARLAEATRLFEQGDNKGALAVLNLEEIEQDVATRHRRIDAAREIEANEQKALQANIEEYKLRIQTLQNEMADGWFDAVCTTYDKALAAARGYVEEKDLAKMMLDYGTFLWENKQYHLVDSLYEETLAIYRKLAEQNPQAFLSNVAGTLNNLAILHSDLQQYTQAEEEYNEALKIYRQLAEQNPQAFLYYVATTLNNFAALHQDLQQYTQAEEEYNEALKIYRQLAEQNPQAFLYYVAGPLHNLATLHKDLQQYTQAEEEYNEALKIYRQLAEQNPQAVLSDVAMTLNNLATLHKDLQQYTQAEEEYNEALKIYRQLAEQNPQAFLYYVAMTLNNFAALHQDLQQYTQAEEEYNEALKIYRQLAEQNPQAFLSDVAGTLYNMSLLHESMGQYIQAEQECQEALEIYSRLAKEVHPIYEQYVANAKNQLADLRKAAKQSTNSHPTPTQQGGKEKDLLAALRRLFRK